jgi:hypothetical protein
MSRKAAVVLLAMIVLVGAMGLKTVVTAHDSGAVMMANGGAPFPTIPLPGDPAPKPKSAAPVPAK